jgi:3-oxosteroid 1-dehydrogenase
VPANHHAQAAGLHDSVEDGLAYVTAAAPPGWAATEAPLWRAFVHQAPNMLLFVERHTRLRMALTAQADPLANLPGARTAGRMLSPRPLRRRLARGLRRHLQPARPWHLFTFQEMLASDPLRHPVRAVFRHAARLLLRLISGARAQGTALIVGLLRGCLDAGCTVMTETPACELILRDGAVTGVVVRRHGEMQSVTARRGVILASGGFEWDGARRERHFPGLGCFIASPSENTGDAHRMVESVGGRLAHMDQANLSPGVPSGPAGSLRALSVYFHHDPVAILVNRSGLRFMNEGEFNLGDRLLQRAGPSGSFSHLPVWCVAGPSLLRRSPLLRWLSRRYRGWTVSASTVAGLARKIGLSADALEATVGRYNEACRQGVDGLFGRSPKGSVGMAAINPRNPVALPLIPTFVSTKGGPRTTERGQVVDTSGTPIPGLFCCGVAMANPVGTRAVGAGTTIGPNMSWGYICGRSLIDG